MIRFLRQPAKLFLARLAYSTASKKVLGRPPLETRTPDFTEQSELLPDWDRGGVTDKISKPSLLRIILSLINSNKGCVCLIQVGGFYELYYEQAIEFAPKLGIKVAFKPQGTSTVPMSGFPLYQLQKYVKLLVQDLHQNVAICEQYQEPFDNYIYRKVSRIITPGTLVDESFMNFNQNNYLAAIYIHPQTAKFPAPDSPVGLSWVDVSVGEFFTQETTLGEVGADLTRISPSEIILSRDLFMDNKDQGAPETGWLDELVDLRRYFVRYHKVIHRDLKLQFRSSLTAVQKKLESFTLREVAAMHMVLSYLNVNFADRTLELDVPNRYICDKFLHMDSRTREALELTERLTSGGTSSVVGSLSSTIRRTVTPSGHRLLIQWLKSPILDAEELRNRQEFVELFLTNLALKMDTRHYLQLTGDLVRSLQRLVIGTSSSNQILLAIGDHTSKLADLQDVLKGHLEKLSGNGKSLLGNFLADFDVPRDLADRITNTLHIDPFLASIRNDSSAGEHDPLGPEETENVTEEYEQESEEKPAFLFSVRPNFTPELTQLHTQLGDVDDVFLKHLKSVKETVLKVDPNARVAWKDQIGRHHNVIHITCRSSSCVSIYACLNLDATVMEKKKTTIVYKPSEWTNLQYKRALIIEEIELAEKHILKELEMAVVDKIQKLRHISRMADFLDVTSSFAVLAEQNNLVRPRFLKSNSLNITKGRHFVVEYSLKQNGEMFTANDTSLGTQANTWVISGPNMGGKSTFLRQNALIVILAQIGSYVPAEKASLGIVDRIFTRIGASDDIFSDLSTFMVEMIETSNILQNATTRSLAIVDEIGRGTSGKEGLAIAYGTLVSMLTKNKCRCLFATHFGRELKQLLDQDKIKQSNVQFWRTKVVEGEKTPGKDLPLMFDHRLEPGISERSYAFEVAKLAGFPQHALEHGKRALQLLEDGKAPGV